MHISSLSSDYGIGTMGKSAYDFVDFLHKAGQSYWQILPICPTGFGDSPYQSFSSFAGNPYFIDLDFLRESGLLKKGDYADLNFGANSEKVDFKKIYTNRYKVFKIAYSNFTRKIPTEFYEFCEKQDFWLTDFALFMAEKDANGGKPWNEWEEQIKKRRPAAIEKDKEKFKSEIQFYKMLQYLFYRQWQSLKEYANAKGIEIIGDLPIYVAGDSADVWASPQNFYLNDEFEPIEVAGCPPDGFTENGQLWGNPLYDWDYMKKDNYSWWIRRIAHCMKIYDVLRIDHFRGFDSYYCIDANEKTAKNGVWRKGPGMDFFSSVKEQLGNLNIIAEDLGHLTPSVKELLQQSGFPGMKVLQFAFDSRENSDYLPHNYNKNCIVYTGTHDNDTLLGWFRNAPEKDTEYAKEYLAINEEEGCCWGMLRGAWASVGNTVIVTAQDILGLDEKSRMNTPSTLGGNWQWRAKKDAFSDELAEKIKNYTKLYNRLNTFDKV